MHVEDALASFEGKTSFFDFLFPSSNRVPLEKSLH